MSSPTPAAYRLASPHRTFSRTTYMRRRYRRSAASAPTPVAVSLGGPLMDTGRDHVLLSPATSVQVFPAPWRGRAAVDLPPETELILVALLLEEEPEHAGCRQPVGQRGGLVMRARRPQPAQQE